MTHFRTFVHTLTLCFSIGLTQISPLSAVSRYQSEPPYLCPDAEIYAGYPVSTVDEQIANVKQFASRLEIRNNATANNPNAVSMTFGFSAGALPRDSALLGIDTYALQAEMAYTVDFFVYYAEGPLTLNLRYLAFLNEQQIDVSEDSQTQYQPLTVPSGTAQSFSFDLPPLASGIYDLILVGIPTDIDDMYVADTAPIANTGTRISLIVGDELSAAIPPRTFTRIETDPENDSFYYELDLYRDGQLSSYIDPGAAVRPGSQIEMDVRMGWIDPRPYVPQERQLPSLEGSANPLPSSEPPVQTALILIRNYEQVDFDDNSRIGYFEMPPDLLYTDIPVTLTAANSIANEDIVVMRVNSPGMPRCLLSPGLNLSAMPSISTKRTVINVE